MTDFSKLLNPEQYAAATAEGGPLLVLAAAGTGKTRTLVHRVACLVERGVEPDRILLLTFTNRAAKEMLDRARAVVGPDAAAIWAGTFHSICARFLRRWGGALGYRNDFQILDEEDQKKLIAEIVKTTVENPKDFPKKEIVLRMISEAANEQLPVAAIASRWQTKAAGFTPEEIVAVANAYATRKREIGAMDFDDLIVNGLKLLKEKADIRGMLQEKFLHVLVDEYQDTNGIQAEFTDLIAAGHRNIMAVGDDFQCIYTWRGAKIENIMRFPERWKDCKIVKLERNYRSVPQVLDAANAIMKNAPGQFAKQLRAIRPQGRLPQAVRVYNGKAQAQEIVSAIRELRASGYACRDIAVLYRSHYQSIDVEKAVNQSAIPYRLTSGTGFYEKEHVKDILAYLRLVVAPHGELSFLRFITLLPGVGETGAKKFWKKLGCEFDPRKSEARSGLGGMLGAKARPLWPAIAAAMAKIDEHLAAGERGMIVMDFLEAFYASYLQRTWEGEEAQERLLDIRELASDLADDQTPLDEYLANIALLTNLDLRKNDPSADRITLSTVHQAKGMEWPAVIIPWVVDGMFPSAKAQEENRLDEERRLFYVAVTRAKDRLMMLAPRVRRSPEGGEFPVTVSPFLRDIPRELLDVRSVDSGYQPPAFNQYRPSYSSGGSPYARSKPIYKTTWRH